MRLVDLNDYPALISGAPPAPLPRTPPSIPAYIPYKYGGGAGQDSSKRTPARYGVMFKCQHGTFCTEGEDEMHKRLSEKLQVGQLVDVTFQEVHDVIVEDGKVTSKTFVKYKFLDANPKLPSPVSGTVSVGTKEAK